MKDGTHHLPRPRPPLHRRRGPVLAFTAGLVAFLMASATGLTWREEVLDLLPDADPVVRRYRQLIRTFRPTDYLYLDVGPRDEATPVDEPETQPLFDASARLGVGFYLGYCEQAEGGNRYNTAILVEAGEVVGKYRKVHLPGNPVYDPALKLQHLEPWYFEDGDLGFPVFPAFGAQTGMLICNDRR